MKVAWGVLLVLVAGGLGGCGESQGGPDGGTGGSSYDGTYDCLFSNTKPDLAGGIPRTKTGVVTYTFVDGVSQDLTFDETQRANGDFVTIVDGEFSVPVHQTGCDYEAVGTASVSGTFMVRGDFDCASRIFNVTLSCLKRDEPWNTGARGSATFRATGADQMFVVPDGVRVIQIKMWGAGGAGGVTSQFGFGAGNGLAVGGNGGYSSGNLAVTAGEVLIVKVGTGGSGDADPNGSVASGSGGGGRSSVGRVDDELIVAAGGGGAGYSMDDLGWGGNGGAYDGGGGNLIPAGNGARAFTGGGGNDEAGWGAKLRGGTAPGIVIALGGYPAGGDGVSQKGGGGDGWYGGGAGTDTRRVGDFGGGGGGSSYVGGIGVTTGFTPALAEVNDHGVVPYSSDPDYEAGIAVGGVGLPPLTQGGTGPAGAGLVVIHW